MTAPSGLAAVLDALIPPTRTLPGGSIAARTLLEDADVAAVLAHLPEHATAADGPAHAWRRLADADPRGAATVLHVLSAAYFADARVRAEYGLDRGGRPEPRSARLEALLARVPAPPGLPNREPRHPQHGTNQEPR